MLKELAIIITLRIRLTLALTPTLVLKVNNYEPC